jgi:ABC-type Zn uptake system ZnuABC Zn-binding protein ZnuA
MIPYTHSNIKAIKEYIDKGQVVTILVEEDVDSSLMDLLVYAVKKNAPVVLYVKAKAREHFYSLMEILGFDKLIKDSRIKIINASDNKVTK